MPHRRVFITFITGFKNNFQDEKLTNEVQVKLFGVYLIGADAK